MQPITRGIARDSTERLSISMLNLVLNCLLNQVLLTCVKWLATLV